MENLTKGVVLSVNFKIFISYRIVNVPEFHVIDFFSLLMKYFQ